MASALLKLLKNLRGFVKYGQELGLDVGWGTVLRNFGRVARQRLRGAETTQPSACLVSKHPN